MNILIDGKEHFFNVENVVNIQVGVPSEGMYTINLINGDKYELEHYSFLYFRDYGSTQFAPFSLEKYKSYSFNRDLEPELAKNKFYPKS